MTIFNSSSQVVFLALIALLNPYALADHHTFDNPNPDTLIVLEYTHTKVKTKKVCSGGGLLGAMNCITKKIEESGAGDTGIKASVKAIVTPALEKNRDQYVLKLKMDLTKSVVSIPTQLDGGTQSTLRNEASIILANLANYTQTLNTQQITSLQQKGKISLALTQPFIDARLLKLTNPATLTLLSSRKPATLDPNNKYTITIPKAQYFSGLAVGDQFYIQVEVEGKFPGQQFEVEAQLGTRMIKLPVSLVDKDENSAAASTKTGIYIFHSQPIDIVHGKNPYQFQNIVVKVANQQARYAIGGMRGTAALALIDDYASNAVQAQNMIDTVLQLDVLSVLLEKFNDVDLYEYAMTALAAGLPRANSPEIIRTYLQQLQSLSEAALNHRLRDDLAKSLKDMVDTKPANLSEQRKLQALVLLKKVALANIINRLSELNHWKHGNGRISRNNYMFASPGDAVNRLGAMRDTDSANQYTQIHGFSGSDTRRASLYTDAAMHAKRKGHRLTQIWDLMQKHRADFQWAQRQTDLVFDWSATRAKYARNYLAAEKQYIGLLGNYQILSTIIQDNDGNSVPTWMAILKVTTRRDENEQIAKSVQTAEQHLRTMLSSIVKMRSEGDLLELASPRYVNLHNKARALPSPIAGSMVNLAIGYYREKKDVKAVYSIGTDIGVWSLYGIGVFFPPVAYAAGLVDVGRSGTDAYLAYIEANSAETSAASGFGSELEKDKANQHLKSAMGQVALDTLFALGDLKALSALRRVRPHPGMQFDSVRALQDRNAIKKIAESDKAYFDSLAKLRADADKHQRLYKSHFENLHKNDNAIKRATAQRNEVERARLIAERAESQRLYVLRKRWYRNKLTEIKKLKVQRIYQGRVPKDYRLQGQDVERAVNHGWEHIFSLPSQRTANNPLYVNMRKIEDGHFMFGERLQNPVRIKIGKKSRTVTMRYEVINKGVIRHPDGKIMTPPEFVDIPGRGRVKTGLTSSRMEFDRIVIDHKERIIYVDDITRSASQKHVTKTWAYAESLQRMYPNYNATNVPLKNGRHWPRDVVYSEFQTPVPALTKDLTPYSVVKGESVR